MDIIVLSKYLSITEKSLSNNKLMEKFLDTVKKEYDYILIDCPPSLGSLSINAFVSSDYVLIPSKTEYSRFIKINDVYETIEEINELEKTKIEVIGVVANAYKIIGDDLMLKKVFRKNYRIILIYYILGITTSFFPHFV